MSAANPTLRRWASSGTVAAGATTAVKAPDSTSDYVYITKMRIFVTTHANAKNLTVQDSAGTPVPICTYNDLTVAAGANQGSPIVYDFGYRGFKATLGKTINIVSDSAGPVAAFTAEGYQSAS
jgi:hypothetical protein